MRLEAIRRWLAGYPGVKLLRADQTLPCPGYGSIVSLGVTELSREEGFLGELTIHNRWDLKLYFVLPKAQEEDGCASANAQWLLELQSWVQEQSVMGKVPMVGDCPQSLRFVAQQGSLEEAKGEGLGVYSVKLSVFFARKILPEMR